MGLVAIGAALDVMNTVDFARAANTMPAAGTAASRATITTTIGAGTAPSATTVPLSSTFGDGYSVAAALEYANSGFPRWLHLIYECVDRQQLVPTIVHLSKAARMRMRCQLSSQGDDRPWPGSEHRPSCPRSTGIVRYKPKETAVVGDGYARWCGRGAAARPLLPDLGLA